MRVQEIGSSLYILANPSKNILSGHHQVWIYCIWHWNNIDWKKRSNLPTICTYSIWEMLQWVHPSYGQHQSPCCSYQRTICQHNKWPNNLLNDNNPVISISRAQCLENFTKFISSGDDNSHIVLVGHNSTSCDTPTLLGSGGLTFKQRLSSLNFFFADSLHLVRSLIKSGNTAFEAHFQEKFDAHDALEDVKTLHKILFNLPLNLTTEEIVNNTNLQPCSHTFDDMLFLDKRFQCKQTFKHKLFNPQSDNGAVKQRVIQKIAESGLAYND